MPIETSQVPLEAQGESERNAFIFQSLPERFDLRKELKEEEVYSWVAARHVKRMKPEDVVYFWMGGDRSIRGMYGWGVIESFPFPDETDGATHVRVGCWYVLKNPILAEEFESDPALQDMSILRKAVGTIFLLTPDEASGLADRIEKRGETPPDGDRLPPLSKRTKGTPEPTKRTAVKKAAKKRSAKKAKSRTTTKTAVRAKTRKGGKTKVKEDVRREGVPVHTDNPARVDELNRWGFATVLADRICEVWENNRKEQIERKTAETAAVAGGARGLLETEESDTAFMVNIRGCWGSGKSSVLNFLEGELTSGKRKRKWVVVKFNAWRHQRLGPPWWYLVKELYRQGKSQLKGVEGGSPVALRWWWFWWRVRADWIPIVVAAVLLVVAAWLFSEGTKSAEAAQPSQVWTNLEPAIKFIGSILATGIAVISVSRSLLMGSKRAVQAYIQMSRDPFGPIIRLYNRLVRVIERPVAVFVDDLDRCEAQYVVELLEGIQTLFRKMNVIYVVAADRDWIRASYEQRYEKFTGVVGESGRPLGQLFLEKVFQVSVPVPRLSEQLLKEYWTGLLRQAKRKVEEVPAKKRDLEAEAAAVVGTATTGEELWERIGKVDKDHALDRAVRVKAARKITAPEARAAAEHRLQSFAPLVERNPRGMKRLVNALAFRQAVNFLEKRHIETESLALWTILELRWPDLAEHLADNPDRVNDVGRAKPRKEIEETPQLKALFKNPDVKAVVKANGVPCPALTAPLIRRICGLSEEEHQTVPSP